jgi:hypothetical protein
MTKTGFEWLGVVKGMEAPTEREAAEMREAYIVHYGLYMEPETIDFDRYIGIARNYTTDGPGYQGDVAIILWPAHPGALTVMTREDGKWVVCKEYGT